MFVSHHAAHSLMQSKHLNNKPALTDKISCPICCVPFQGIYRPMICCQNRHTICMKCIDGIIQKSLTTTQQQCLCPICRQRIQMPLESSQEMKQFLDLIHTLNEMYKNIDNWQQRTFRSQRQLRETKQQLALIKKKSQSNENLIELLKMENKDLKLRLQKMSSRPQSHQKENIFMPSHDKEQKTQKKLPLSAFIDNMPSQQHLNLVKREFSVRQVQYLVMYDMSKLVEVNLSFNNLGDEGLYILIREKIMPNLISLKLSNNQITRLPCLKHINQLEQLDLCNFNQHKNLNANRIKDMCIENLFQEKWEKLKVFGIQFENDKVWQQDDFQNTFVERFPTISKLQLSNCKARIPKTRCQRIKNALNEKGKRVGNNKIAIIARNH